MSNTESTLEALTARQEIRDVLSRYCRGLDRMDREMALSVWHPDGTCDYLGMFTGTGSGFVDWVWVGHAGMLRHSHQITNVLIEVDGDHAASEAYVTATLWSKPEDAPTEIISRGRYLDRWSKRDGRWAIDHRAYVNDLMTVTPLPTDSWAAVAANGSRDTDDPSYGVLASASATGA